MGYGRSEFVCQEGWWTELKEESWSKLVMRQMSMDVCWQSNCMWNIKDRSGTLRGGWKTLKPRSTFGLSLWKSIRKHSIKVRSCIKIKTGNGWRTMFWEHNWHTETPFSQCFQEMLRITKSSKAFKKDLRVVSGHNAGWNLQVGWQPKEWELDQFGQQQLALDSINFTRKIDRPNWVPEKMRCSLLERCILRWWSWQWSRKEVGKISTSSVGMLIFLLYFLPLYESVEGASTTKAKIK